MAVPVDEAAGPARSSLAGDFNTCFAPTTEGAVFAAIYFVAETGESKDTSLLYQLVADGTVQDELRTASATPSSEVSSDIQVQGFRVDSHDNASAEISIAVQITDAGTGAQQLVGLPCDLKWEHGDWKQVVTPSGSVADAIALSSLGGYTPFGVDQ